MNQNKTPIYPHFSSRGFYSQIHLPLIITTKVVPKMLGLNGTKTRTIRESARPTYMGAKVRQQTSLKSQIPT